MPIACSGPGNLNLKSRTRCLPSEGKIVVGMWRETVHIHFVYVHLTMFWLKKNWENCIEQIFLKVFFSHFAIIMILQK